MIVLGDDDDLAPINLHRPLGGVFELELKAGLSLLGVGLQGAGATVDEGDLESVGRRRTGGGEERRGEGQVFD
jgi:hypothetical protein